MLHCKEFWPFAFSSGSMRLRFCSPEADYSIRANNEETEAPTPSYVVFHTVREERPTKSTRFLDTTLLPNYNSVNPLMFRVFSCFFRFRSCCFLCPNQEEPHSSFFVCDTLRMVTLTPSFIAKPRLLILLLYEG